MTRKERIELISAGVLNGLFVSLISITPIRWERSRMDKEWEVEATIEIKTSFFCDTKEEAEKQAHKYLEELCTGLYPDCCSNSYEIENIYSYSED